jgi:hypothetical protein
MSDKIMIWYHRHDTPVDESLIPPGKEPGILDIPNGLNLPEVYDQRWSPTD